MVGLGVDEAVPALQIDESRAAVSLYDDLYDYQVDAAESLKASKARAQILQLPTGGGKTVVAAAIMERLAAKGNRALVLVHRKELLSQFRETLLKHSPEMEVSVIRPGATAIPWAPVTLASIQSLVRRLDKVRAPTMIITDEAHHACAGSYEKVYKQWPNALRLGLTATPERPDGKPLGQWYSHIVRGPSITELVARKRLAPMRVLRVPSSFVRKGLKRRGTEFDAGAQEERLMTGRAVGEAVSAYEKYASDRKAIVFAVSRRHSKALAARFAERGWRSAHLDGTTGSGERDSTMRAFASGEIQVLSNVDLFGEGLDVPACDCVIMQRATMSIVRYMQDAGRAMRYLPGKEALLLDLVGNTYHFGTPEMEREWSLDGKDEPVGAARKPRVNDLRICQFCATIFERKHVMCPHCGQEPDHRPVQEIDTELVDVNDNKPPRQPARATSAEVRNVLKLAWRARTADDAKTILADFAKARGYKPAWAHMQYAVVMRGRGSH